MNSIKVAIKNKIHNIRGKQVMFDRDLADLYGVSTKRLNEQVKRNTNRFPEDFMFQLTKMEFEYWRSQIATSKSDKKGLRYKTYAFTELGVSMLSSVLRSEKAVEINILIMRAFVEMRHYLSQNFEVFEKFQKIDKKFLVYDDNFNKIFDAMEKKEFPAQGIFFEGKVFDAFLLVSDIIKDAKKRIILVDNYLDENTLKLFSNKRKGVEVKIYTKNITEKLLFAVKKFNEQHQGLEIIRFEKSHDRFLIIDKELYHFGASLKDLGKKWFAFSKLTIKPEVILSELPVL